MTDHDHTHDERLARVAFDGESAGSELLATLARCDDCLTALARALEDALVLGPAGGARAPRLTAILDEVMVWRAVLEDAAEHAVEAGVELPVPGKQKGE